MPTDFWEDNTLLVCLQLRKRNSQRFAGMSSLQATPRDVTKIHSLAAKKFCPGETRISQQLALQCLLVAGTGWSGVEVAASGSHLVSLQRIQRQEGGLKELLSNRNWKEKREKLKPPCKSSKDPQERRRKE